MAGRTKALLLDLDNTLLINDMDAFAPRYFAALTKKIDGICDPGRFLEALQLGTRAMMRNDGSNGTNAEVFAAAFFPRVGRSQAELMPILDEFYAVEFNALSKYTARDPQAKVLVETALAHGLQLAVATQPLFPYAAIEARLNWAGVGPGQYAYDVIATYDTFSACKPRALFFQTMLDRLGRSPDECIMVGDSLEADMPARRLRIRTFLVDRGQLPATAELPCEARGSLQDLSDMIDTGGIHEL